MTSRLIVIAFDLLNSNFYREGIKASMLRKVFIKRLDILQAKITEY